MDSENLDGENGNTNESIPSTKEEKLLKLQEAQCTGNLQ